MKTLPLFAIIMIVGGFTYWNAEPSEDRSETGQVMRYFATPQSSVEIITRLLEAEDWKTLASYYDLSGAKVARQSLLDGSFFIATERPESAHPAGFWRYKQPFAPGFKFQSAKLLGTDIIEVTVAVEIDQGGEPGEHTVQRGFDSFKLKAHPEGYQLLPKP